MCSYLYELPTTGAISFGDFLYDQTSSYIAEISDTTEARANLRTVLKESKRTDEKDHLRLVKVLDEYIPKLCGIIAAVNAGELVLKVEPMFSWRTTLSSSVFNASPRLSLPSLAAELAFVLLTYAFALSNFARTVVGSLGTYEIERGLSEKDRQAKDERLGFAVTLLCKAGGIFEYIAKEVCADWDAARERASAAGTHCPHPPDLRREVLIGLSKMALADAQNLAIRKLLTRAAFENVVSPGPPLPKSHPSPALAAKLHLECVALYSSARALVKTPGASRSSSYSPKTLKAKLTNKASLSPGSGDASEDVTPELRRYLSDEIALHSALAHKWLGVDAGESTSSDTGSGVAVGFLTWAKKELDDLKGGGGSGINLGVVSDREREMREARKARVSVELESTSVFLKGYKRMNDSMSFQTVPPQSELQGQIPAGRMAIAIRPYTRPTPAFGPGSVEYVRRRTEELDALAEDDDGNTSVSPSTNQERSYSGAGAYF